MKIDMGQKTRPDEGEQQNQGKTVISQNLVRTSVFLDAHGNQIDPRTKQIIRKAEEL